MKTDRKRDSASGFRWPLVVFVLFIAVIGVWVGLTRVTHTAPGVALLLTGGFFAILSVVAYVLMSLSETKRVYDNLQLHEEKRDGLVRKNLELEARVLALSSGSHSALYELGSKFFGLYRPSISVVLLVNDNGSATSTYAESLIAAHGNVIRSIPHQCTASHADPEGSEFRIDNITKEQVGLHIETKEEECGATKLVWKVLFSPQLPADRPADCEYQIYFPPLTFAPNIKCLKEEWKYDKDWFVVPITYPTKFMDIKVGFVHPMRPDSPHAEVWIAPDGKEIHSGEMQRIEDHSWFKTFDEKETRFATLHVDYPVHGALYAICWLPAK